jgi:hypothetical protein
MRRIMPNRTLPKAKIRLKAARQEHPSVAHDSAEILAKSPAAVRVCNVLLVK